MHTRIAIWLVKYRLQLFVASLVLMALCGYGLKQLTFSSDYRVFFKPDNPQLVANEYIQSTFSRSDNVLLVLHPKNDDVFTPDNLAAVEWLTDKAWKLPY